MAGINRNNSKTYRPGIDDVAYGAAPINLSTIAAGTSGFVINGQSAGDQSGWSVSAAGDVNGDGLANLLAAAYAADPSSGGNAGKSYVIFGSTSGAFAKSEADWIATASDLNHAGTSASETFIGNASANTITSGGGADVIYAGAGNDVIAINASASAKLQSSYSAVDGQLARIDGGAGFDAIRLTGGASLDLTKIANQAAGASENGSRISSIEKIDMATDAAANVLTLSVKDVLAMAGMNVCNSGNGWTDLGAAVARHQVVIDGGANDRVALTDKAAWFSAGTAVANGHAYDVYNHGTSAAQLLVDHTLAASHPVL
jgi:Ca2+-binding RTX toxin-like protein